MEEIDYTKEDGTVIKVVPKEAYDTVAAKATQTEAELTEARRINAEKTTNFQKYNELTEEQKKAYTENEVNMMRRGDDLEEKLNTVTKTLEETNAANQKNAKDSVLRNFHLDDDATKAKIEENYALLAAMPETTPTEITARAEKAAIMAGVSVDSRNPLNIPLDGTPPTLKQPKEFVETPKGEEAAAKVRAAMNLPTPK